jgi:serine/threonine protein kinase
LIRLGQEPANNDYIVGLYEVFEAPDHCLLVMELCSGGALDEYMYSNKPRYNEYDALKLMANLLHGLVGCHEANIAHLDIKPGNLLLVDPDDDDTNVKLGDFGLAVPVDRLNSLSECRGTPAYMAPEVYANRDFVCGHYDHRADLYSAGAVLHELLEGELFDRDYVMQDTVWRGISSDTQELITNLLATNPAVRYSAETALVVVKMLLLAHQGQDIF